MIAISSPSQIAYANDASGIERVSSATNAAVYGFLAGDLTGQFFNFFLNSTMLIPGSSNYNPTQYVNNQATWAAAVGAIGAVVLGVIGYNNAKNRQYQSELTVFGGQDEGISPPSLGVMGGARFRLSVLELSGVLSSLKGVPGLSSPRFYAGLTTDGSFPLLTFLGWHSFIGAGSVGSPSVVWGFGPTVRISRFALQFQVYLYFNNPTGGILGINPQGTEADFALSYSF